MYSTLLDWEFPADRVMLCFSLLVKCLKNTPAFFAERLNKAMRVCNMHVEDLGRGVSAPPVPGHGLRVKGLGRHTSAKRTEGPWAGGV